MVRAINKRMQARVYWERVEREGVDFWLCIAYVFWVLNASLVYTSPAGL